MLNLPYGVGDLECQIDTTNFVRDHTMIISCTV